MLPPTPVKPRHKFRLNRTDKSRFVLGFSELPELKCPAGSPADEHIRAPAPTTLTATPLDRPLPAPHFHPWSSRSSANNDDRCRTPLLVPAEIALPRTRATTLLAL